MAESVIEMVEGPDGVFRPKERAALGLWVAGGIAAAGALGLGAYFWHRRASAAEASGGAGQLPASTDGANGNGGGAPAMNTEEKAIVKQTRFALQSAPWKLNVVKRRRLDKLEEENHPLYQAYLMKESLVATFDVATPDDIHDLLMDWLQWIEEQGPPPFQKAANTIAEHFEGVCAYVETRRTCGRVLTFLTKGPSSGRDLHYQMDQADLHRDQPRFQLSSLR